MTKHASRLVIRETCMKRAAEKKSKLMYGNTYTHMIMIYVASSHLIYIGVSIIPCQNDYTSTAHCNMNSRVHT